MHAMQYELTLPADYDMSIIERRVRDRGNRTDDFPGLRFKAYLVRRRGVDGSPVNQYAPFYVWNEADGMAAFLWGGRGFGGIVADFGRPPVRHWVVAHLSVGVGLPVVCTRERLAIVGDPADVVPGLSADAGPGIHSVTIAVDPLAWTAERFTLWTEPPPLDLGVDRWDVLHLSQPLLGS